MPAMSPSRGGWSRVKRKGTIMAREDKDKRKSPVLFEIGTETE